MWKDVKKTAPPRKDDTALSKYETDYMLKTVGSWNKNPFKDESGPR